MWDRRAVKSLSREGLRGRRSESSTVERCELVPDALPPPLEPLARADATAAEMVPLATLIRLY